MSDYPSAPHYGANYGGQNQHPPYLPPTYPNQYSQPDDGHMGQHNYAQTYDANISAYGYNGAVPGFSAAALASGAPPLPIYQGWNQESIPLPPYSAPQNTMQHTGYAPSSYNNYPQHYPQVPQHSYQQNIPPPIKPYDEGEVSEGEFEGGYAPPNPSTVDYGATQYGGNSGNGYVDTAHRAVYARPQDPPTQAAHPGNEYSYPREPPPQLRRQHSGSFSPYNPLARDDDGDERHLQKQNYNTSIPNHKSEQYTNGTAHTPNKPLWDQNGIRNPSRSSSRANGSHAKKRDSPAAKNLPVPVTAPSIQSHLAHPLPIQDAAQDSLGAVPVQPTPPPKATVYDKLALRKKAEGAILNLLPHDIRYEKYVEEGIASDIIGSLFDDLRVPRTSSKLANDLNLPHKLPENHTSAVKFPNGVSLPSKPGAPAPKLDEKAERNHNPSSLNGVSASPPTMTANLAKTAATTDKERTLQMKMEALRKSREERAQKAAAKNNVKPLSAAAPAPVAELEKPKPAPASTSTMQNPNSPTASPQESSQQSQIRSIISQPPPQPVTAPQAPTIPGLFLASAIGGSAPSIITNGTMYGTLNNTRKRPVAADFDAPAAVAPFKRPFGHSRSDTPLVIDVSEEDDDSDDEDVAMDLDSQADQDSPVQSARKMSDQRNSAIQNLPTLTNFPPRKPFTPPPASSTASTPPVFPPSRKATLGKPEDLQAKEMQIEELRRKIAEAEAAKAQKKAQQSASGTQTPRPNSSNTGLPPNDSMAKKVEASLQMQNMINLAEEKVTSDQKLLIEAQAIEQEKASELKKQEAERKRLRREKIATDLPRVDAEVLEKQRKLEQLKAQMAEIEAAVQKNLEDKQRMAEEMERLGQEAEEQLQAQKDKLKDLTGTETGGNATPSRHDSLPIAEAETLPSLALDTKQLQSLHSNETFEPAKEVESVPTNGEPPVPIHTSTPAVMPADRPNESIPSEDGPSEKEPGEDRDKATADQDLETALQEAVRAEADSHDAHKDGDEMDIKESYAPSPSQLAPDSTSNSLEDGNRSPSYSPVLGRGAPSMSDRQSDADYEPPDATQPVNSLPLQSPPFSPAPADLVTEEAGDLVIFPSDSNPLATDENETVEDPLPQTNGSVHLTEENSINKSDKVQFYTPYESPLKEFRAFRFHPEFNQEVSGGFRSLTYSHKINPNVELCHWEMAGGACNDKTCEFQHFRNIGLTDDVVLSTLGSPDEFTGEQRKLFCDGLKEVLSGLRARKVRDFDIIAKEVVAHRARFLGDKSKVLMLDGTTI